MIGILLILLIVIIIVFNSSWGEKRREEAISDEFIEMQFYGVVSKIDYDINNHNELFIFFKNSQNKIPLTFIKNNQSILNKIYCGDSIVKKKNTSKIDVFRGHKKVKVQTLIIKF
ncbi:MAG: hypothetical protein RIR55_1837 [Bacteroidota bacterium]